MSECKHRNKGIIKFFSLVLIAALLLANVIFVSATEEMFLVSNRNTIVAPNLIPNVPGANAWQVVAEKYMGNSQGNKSGYDLDKDGRNDIFYQKNVVPTDIENEFLVYTGITKVMTWDELLAESSFGLTTQGSWKDSHVGQIVNINDIGGKDTNVLIPGKDSAKNNYLATIYFKRDGKIIRTVEQWFHGNTPNADNCTGYIILKGLVDEVLIASTQVNLNRKGGSGKDLSYTIDLDKMSSQNIHYAVDEILADSVVDPMGEYVSYESVTHADGKYSYNNATRTLTWEPVSNGVTGVQVKENGGLTGYHYNIHQLVYRVHLNVEQKDFMSCAQNMNSKVGDNVSYSVSNKAVMNCSIKNTAYKGSPEFKAPYVRGLLYDIEFQKVLEGSKVPLEGIEFTVTRKANGSTHAEKLEYADKAVSGSDGYVKFRNLPWGMYEIMETSLAAGNSFQRKYIADVVPASIGNVDVCYTTRPGLLENNHGTGHSVDQPTDINNKLFVFNNGTYENKPNRARITIEKQMNAFDKLDNALKGQKYLINAKSLDCYMKPGLQDNTLNNLDEKNQLGHMGTVTYDLIVPEDGGTIDIKEVIPDNLKDKILFDSAEIVENPGSTAGAQLNKQNQGCQIKIMPGNDIVVKICNTPVGTVRIKKVIDNYRHELSKDSFIIKATSVDDTENKIKVDTVLNHNEMSYPIIIREVKTLDIEEVLPKEYYLTSIEVTGGASISGNQVTVRPGEDVLITIHNKYLQKPFFHVSDQVKNIFRWK